jgi:hypothetical protein
MLSNFDEKDSDLIDITGLDKKKLLLALCKRSASNLQDTFHKRGDPHFKVKKPFKITIEKIETHSTIDSELYRGTIQLGEHESALMWHDFKISGNFISSNHDPNYQELSNSTIAEVVTSMRNATQVIIPSATVQSPKLTIKVNSTLPQINHTHILRAHFKPIQSFGGGCGKQLYNADRYNQQCSVGKNEQAKTSHINSWDR